jgi:hypothetical protein
LKIAFYCWTLLDVFKCYSGYNSRYGIVFSSFALADTVTITGVAYGTALTEELTPTPDGNTLVGSTNHSIWAIDGLPEGFPSNLSANCQNMSLRSAEFANLGLTWACTATDVDGDGFINVGGDPNPDWSGCFYKTVAGWGKYAGLAQSGTCAFGGNISADGKDWALTFGGDFTTP